MKRLGRISVMTMGIIALSLILGLATSHGVRAAVSALVTVANTPANPVPTQDVEARNAFQAEFETGFGSTPVTIPAGQRLVVDFVTINGEVNSLTGPIQPSVIFQSSINGGPTVNYYLQPAPNPVPLPQENQLYLAQPVKIYADTLTLGAAFAGFAPNFYALRVSISGHLIPIT
jgi:hypothetical protein